MNKYFINKKYYYSSLDIIKNAPLYLKGVRNGREMIKKQQIEHPDFIYARLNEPSACRAAPTDCGHERSWKQAFE